MNELSGLEKKYYPPREDLEKRVKDAASLINRGVLNIGEGWPFKKVIEEIEGEIDTTGGATFFDELEEIIDKKNKNEMKIFYTLKEGKITDLKEKNVKDIKRHFGFNA